MSASHPCQCDEKPSFTGSVVNHLYNKLHDINTGYLLSVSPIVVYTSPLPTAHFRFLIEIKLFRRCLPDITSVPAV